MPSSAEPESTAIWAVPAPRAWCLSGEQAVVERSQHAAHQEQVVEPVAWANPSRDAVPKSEDAPTASPLRPQLQAQAHSCLQHLGPQVVSAVREDRWAA